MSKTPQYVITSNWYRDVIKNPVTVMDCAFKCTSVSGYRDTITSMFLHGYSRKVYRDTDPATLLFMCKMIESLINAAYVAFKENRVERVEIPEDNFLQEQFYCDVPEHGSQWDFFPRTLSLKEYRNPNLAFKAFFRYQNIESWKMYLLDIVEGALSESGAYHDLDTFPHYLYLTKLVEACHLIVVRKRIQMLEKMK